MIVRWQTGRGSAARRCGSSTSYAAGWPAEDALADALAAMKQAEEAFDAASDRFDAGESALGTARAERAQTRVERYTAQAGSRAGQHQRRPATAAGRRAVRAWTGYRSSGDTGRPAEHVF
jgi:hypothetical protein